MNRGIDIEKEEREQDGTEWKFGAAAKPLFNIPREQRIFFLPKGEVQKGLEDTMDCATRGPGNKLEAEFTYGVQAKKFSPANIKWLKEMGYADEDGRVTFSDAFNAILSGTTPSGNSLKAPLQSMHEHGLIPKKMLPLLSDMTFADYHSPDRITIGMRQLGQEFISRFSINYKQVNRDEFLDANNEDMVVVAGYAWPEPVDGVYPATEDQPNHVFLLVEPEYEAFDNYEEEPGDFLKKLARDFKFYKTGYQVFCSAENAPKKKTWLEMIISFFSFIHI